MTICPMLYVSQIVSKLTYLFQSPLTLIFFFCAYLYITFSCIDNFKDDIFMVPCNMESIREEIKHYNLNAFPYAMVYL